MVGNCHGSAPVPLRVAPLRVATLLTPDERLRVDAAGIGLYAAQHCQSVNEVASDLRTQQSAAVILSANCCDPDVIPHIARMVREFPRVPAVALVSQYSLRSAQAVLLLGRCGVRTLVDIRDAGGWKELRALLASDRVSDLRRVAQAQLTVDLAGAPKACLRFFHVLFDVAPHTTTVRTFAEALGAVPSTLMSRFYRYGLPAPKHYLALARLTFAANLFENTGLSVAAVANQLDYSSPQSFGRHIQAFLRLTAGEFREQYDGEGMLQVFRERDVLPFLSILRAFDPGSAL